ncbi:MAG: hypothetical protein AUI83_03650 [Armatimonadetes bacterium 13_1_40CM_3_65_7]|nr:MAG: hypothetical protein AUI83_03650 [Armatimonadetes bacterium 13_1_40CM_3_65_7]
MKRLLSNAQIALSHINKRVRFAGAVFALVPLLVATAVWVTKADDDGREASVIGAGRIGNPIRGTMIPSASDFGFAVSERGGTFVCSMAGPETGGFAGFSVMLVEGPVTPGSLEFHQRDVSFSGFATIALIPGLNGASQTVLDGVPYTVSARRGPAKRARMILNIPAFTQALGGDTGGVVAQGDIRIER